jgi:flavonoid 3'-monooxygenase
MFPVEAASVCSLLVGVLLVFVLLLRIRKKKIRLPPGPPGWPIIGNLLQLGDRPHESLFCLAQKYGALMSLKLGNKLTVVVSSPSMAKEVLKTNDQTFSSRSVTVAARTFAYQGATLVWIPYGPQWRFLRRICTTELFSAKRLDALQHLRREEVNRTIGSIFEDSREGHSVNIGTSAFVTSLSLVGRMVCGKLVFHPGSQEAAEFKDMVWEVLKLAGTPNLSDVFPCLERFDLQGLNRRMKSLARRFDSLFDRIIEERLQDRGAGVHDSCSEGKDFLEVMLDLKKDGTQFTLEDIKGMLMDMFIAGTDTTSATVEWAMAELLRKPTLLKKAQAELDEVVGQQKKMEESDIAKLPYLQAVVKEVLRLHPAAPLIIPRRSDNSCEIGGYVVPENTQVFVNVWGIGRDPNVWKEPLEFNPERFLECNTDYRGQDFELIPFGAGRRICIGLPLAHRMVHFVLGSLLHAFNWCIPMVNKDEDFGVDMSEMFGITLQKAVPLIAIPTPRLPIKLY